MTLQNDTRPEDDPFELIVNIHKKRIGSLKPYPVDGLEQYTSERNLTSREKLEYVKACCDLASDRNERIVIGEVLYARKPLKGNKDSRDKDYDHWRLLVAYGYNLVVEFKPDELEVSLAKSRIRKGS